jgi:tetratricopeptide (TPR) repeat protein
MLAKMYSVRGQHDKAAVSIRTAIDLDAKNAAAAAAAKQQYSKNGELVREYFDVLETGKMWDQLLTEANGFVTQDPTTANKIWWLWAKRAVALRNKGDNPGAMNDFQKAMEIVQAEPNVNQDSLIYIIDKIKENLGAGQAVARVLTLAKNADAEKAARWKVVLAYLYYQNKESAKAAQTIQDAIKECQALENVEVRTKNLISALNVAGTLYMMNEEGTQFEQARVAYDQLLSLRKDDLGALNNLACIMAEHTTPPDMNKAMAYSNRAIEVMKERKIEEPNVLDTHGWILVLSGGTNVDKGIEKLHESLKAGEIPEAHYHLGEAYLNKGIPEAAKRALDKANQIIYDKKERKEIFDEKLKPKVEDALVRAEKALLKGQ